MKQSAETKVGGVYLPVKSSTHSSRVLSFNQGPVVFIWNDDKRTHSLTMKRNE